MDQLINNLQAALAALRAAKPNPSQWSGPAASALTTRIDLLEIEFVVISSLLSAATLGGLVGGGVPGIPGGGKLPGGILGGLPIGATPVVPLNTLLSQLGLHF
jgi:hypothetical protein